MKNKNQHQHVELKHGTGGGKGDREAGPKNLSRAPAQAEPTGALAIPADMQAEALAALARALNAQKRFWSKGGSEWIVEPDYAAQLKAAELTLAYAVGRPVERRVELTGSFEAYDEKLEKLCSTPEGLKLATAAGLVSGGEERRTVRKGAKIEKVLADRDFLSLNKPKKAESDALKSDTNASGLF